MSQSNETNPSTKQEKDPPSRRFKWQQFDDDEIKKIFDRHFNAQDKVYTRSQMGYYLNLRDEEEKAP